MYTRGSVTKRENEAYMTFSAKDEIKHLGASEVRKVIHRTIRRSVW